MDAVPEAAKHKEEKVKNDTSTQGSQRGRSTKGLAAMRVFAAIAAPLIMGAILFGAAGRLDWVMGWIYVAVSSAGYGYSTLTMSPELAAERGGFHEGVKNWDKMLVSISGLFSPLGTLIVAGLDFRNGWSPAPALTPQLVTLGFFSLSYVLFNWAIAANAFFSKFVRIQKDRGHSVVTSGPYRYVRHPGYVARIVEALATPVLLGSLWALIPATLCAITFIVRTALEDRTLQDELEGYTDYAQRVRYRLLPGVW
jgi:protein-S-isoprenylcysteine O-methyltransferase Ste14